MIYNNSTSFIHDIRQHIEQMQQHIEQMSRTSFSEASWGWYRRIKVIKTCFIDHLISSSIRTSLIFIATALRFTVCDNDDQWFRWSIFCLWLVNQTSHGGGGGHLEVKDITEVKETPTWQPPPTFPLHLWCSSNVISLSSITLKALLCDFSAFSWLFNDLVTFILHQIN